MATRTPWPGSVVDGEIANDDDFNSIPGGWIGDASVTSNQSGITSEVAVTGLAVTPTVAASRKIKVTVCLHVEVDASSNRVIVRVKAGGTTLQTFRLTDTNANLADTAHFSVFHSPSAGAVAYTVTVERTTGAGTATVSASATSPATLLVEDMGPSS